MRHRYRLRLFVLSLFINVSLALIPPSSLSEPFISPEVIDAYLQVQGSPIASNGNLFHAQIQASQDDLASRLDLSREWVCKLLSRLEAKGWIISKAIRLPDGKFLPCYFRPGGQLKRVLCILLKYRRKPRPSRVNTPSQYVPSPEVRKKSLLFIRELKEMLSKKMKK